MAKSSIFYWLPKFLDLVLPTLTLVLFNLNSLYPLGFELYSIVYGLLFLLISQNFHIYGDWQNRSILLIIFKISVLWFISWVLLTIIFFLIYPLDIQNTVLIELNNWFFYCWLGILVYRIFLKSLLLILRSFGYYVSNVIIVGINAQALDIAHSFIESNYSHYNFVGFVSDGSSNNINLSDTNHNALGDIYDLKSIISDFKINEVMISSESLDDNKTEEILNLLTSMFVTVKILYTGQSKLYLYSKMDYYKNFPIISLFESPLRSSSVIIYKKIFDVAFSLIAIFVCMPAMIIISFLIKIDSKGPIIYKQNRIGFHGREIKIFKFRSMNVIDDDKSVIQATNDDDRVTLVGRYLRKYSLDELPQLFNVLKGEMSIIGPRPHAVVHNNQFRTMVPKYMLRHYIKPGITGYAQSLGFRGETNTFEKIEKRVLADIYYLNNWSILLDIKIILKTLKVVITNRNAY